MQSVANTMVRSIIFTVFYRENKIIAPKALTFSVGAFEKKT